MSSAYTDLLDATIRELEDRKAHGAKFVQVNPGTLQALGKSAPKPQRSITPPTSVPAVGRSPVTTPSAQISSRAQVISPQSASAPIVAPATGSKELAMAELRARVLACVKCPNLVAARTSVVFGVGDIHSPLMFVGEAPGADEDAQGEPFVGAAGQLLTKIIQTMGLSRQTVYIANILKCRPDMPGKSSGNRKPTLEEMKTCSPYLLEQINLIQPKVIVALGATAVEGLLANKTGITRLRGNWQTFNGVPVMPTYHPAYLLHNQALSEKRKVWEDMLAVMERLGMDISEKQRGYFSRSG